MEDTEFKEDDIIRQVHFDNLEQLDWENLFNGLPDSSPPLVSESSSPESVLNPSPDSLSSWIGQVESLLMKDDDNWVDGEHTQLFSYDFLADILVDSPAEASGNGVDTSNDKYSSGSDNGNGGVSETEKEREKVVDNGADVKNGGEDHDDPISRNRRRQLRNRDAAVRSRERKKMYVRDLEIKNRYLEGECRRLGRLLQCFIAENQVLRLGLQKGNAFGVTSTKQESAVLFLESLLLGSLLWFLGIMCLFPLPMLPQSTLLAVLLRNVEKEVPERGVGGSEMFVSLLILLSFVNGRRCKASRTRMKAGRFFMGVLV